MPRQGLNCTLSYTDGTTAYTYSVRAGIIGYGVDMVYAEDQARISRAYYPHRSANQQFSLQVLLKSWDERSDFVNWMSAYAQYALDPNAVRTVFPFMQVLVPVRNFNQQGMPLSGFEWGAHAGMMAFSPVFVFEAAQSPGQNSASVVTSSVIDTTSAYASDPAVQYFYPFSTQLEASQVPTDYGTILPVSGTAPAVNGTAQSTLTQITAPPGTTSSALVPGVSSAAAIAAAGYPSPGVTNAADAASSPGVAILQS
jgi:hypothetical protein